MKNERKNLKEKMIYFTRLTIFILLVLAFLAAYIVAQTSLLWWFPGLGIKYTFIASAIIGYFGALGMTIILHGITEEAPYLYWLGLIGYFVAYFYLTKHIADVTGMEKVTWKLVCSLTAMTIGAIKGTGYRYEDMNGHSSNKYSGYSSSYSGEYTSGSSATSSYSNNTTKKSGNVFDGNFRMSDSFFHDKKLVDSSGNKYYLDHNLLSNGATIRDTNGNKQLKIERNIWGDASIIKDKDGNRVGKIERSVWGDHSNVYDNKGNKIGEMRDDIWGEHKDYTKF